VHLLLRSFHSTLICIPSGLTVPSGVVNMEIEVDGRRNAVHTNAECLCEDRARAERVPYQNIGFLSPSLDSC
jgi:hypothetical protein